MLKENFMKALSEAIGRAGSQTMLAKNSGMQQSRISDYLSGRYDFYNITIGSLLKLFPELEIHYFRDNRPKTRKRSFVEIGTVDIGGENKGYVITGNNVHAGSHHSNPPQIPVTAMPPVERDLGIDPAYLSKKLRKDERFTAEEKIKFLDFIDDLL